MQEANEIKKALEKIDDRLPDGLKAADMESKMGAVESVVDELDALNAERTRLVDVKTDCPESSVAACLRAVLIRLPFCLAP
ncbi:MAG: hypothetical protein D3905_16810, partial [Candidatus Electrothrix sp. AS4_5]|nr:hypothetical protein [Candidatus Electrothrix gigas]